MSCLIKQIIQNIKNELTIRQGENGGFLRRITASGVAVVFVTAFVSSQIAVASTVDNVWENENTITYQETINTIEQNSESDVEDFITDEENSDADIEESITDEQEPNTDEKNSDADVEESIVILISVISFFPNFVFISDNVLL